jgi:hypothetical protein
MENVTPGGSYNPPPPAGGGSMQPPVDGSKLVHPANPPKDPVIILVLNLLLFGCVGYFILGQWQKGIAMIIFDLVIGIPTCGFGIAASSIFGAIDGYMQAQQLQAGKPVGQWTFFGNHA